VGNAVVHFEVGAADDELLAAFYGELFGWGIPGLSGAGYTMIDTRGGTGINGGVGRSENGRPWSTFYVETDDPRATLEKAISLGGSTVPPPANFAGAATIAAFHDPDGLLVGLVQTATRPSPAGAPAPSAGPGAPVTWFEVMGADAARTQRFYAGLFGWSVDSSAFPGYATVDTGAGRGIQGGLGGGEQSRWAAVYAKVDDVDQVLSRAEKLGGSRVRDPGVPALKAAARAAVYGSAGTMKTGALRDPSGNVFGIYSY
jgi:uncharacterized protein